MRIKLLLPTLLVAVSSGANAQNAAPFWSLSGNNNASGASKLGNTNGVALSLATNNLSRIYIAPDGKVGIGTTAPTSLFNVQGPTLLSIFTSTDVLGPQSGSGVIGYTKFLPTAAGQRLGYFLTGSQGGGSSPGNGTGMAGYADGPWSSTSRPAFLTFETTKTGTVQRSEAMRISSSGYVGIGTVTPVYRLHVADQTLAIFAEGKGSGSTGVYGSGVERGVSGIGNIGVYGTSTTSSGNGVHGYASGLGAFAGYFESKSSYGIYATISNESYAGYFNASIYTTGTYQGSDKKLKKNIAEFSDALSIIDKLKPRIYEFLTEGKMAEMNLPKGKHYGLIAQDLEAVLPNLVKETYQYGRRSGDTTAASKNTGVSTENPQTFKAVNYTELIPILIKGLQEEHAEKEALKQKVQQQDEKLQTLEAEMQELKALLLSNNPNGSHTAASLEVPVPNPAKGSTNIRYAVPAGTGSARLTIVNMLGQVMKEVKLNGGTGTLNMDVSGLASGTYPCTLWVNGQATVSKQLVVVH